jgi:pRiA4b ORF-3-like protein
MGSIPTASRAANPGTGGRTLDAETDTANPLLPTDRKWAIRFHGSTVTIVLGMKDYGRGWFSAYFAGLVAARLGIPFQRIRVYYSGTFPAVLQTPMPPSTPLRRTDVAPVAGAVVDVLEGLCDQVIENGRSAFAATAGVSVTNVSFDHSTGQFFVLDRERSADILEIAEAIRSASREVSHAVECERIIDTEATGHYPPEDVGAPWGYREFLDAIADPSHEEHNVETAVDRQRRRSR